MGFNFALVLDIKFFKGIVHIIKVNIIYRIWYPNYMEFNLAPIVDIKSFIRMISLELSKQETTFVFYFLI